jgi:hypothetical protein
MRRIGWALRLLTISNLIFFQTVARADDFSRSNDADRILDEWHRRGSSITAIEATFRMTRSSSKHGESRWEGRAVVASPNLALFDEVKIEGGKDRSANRRRMIWNGTDVFLFSFKDSSVYHQTSREPSARPPIPLCVPFLFRMNPSEAEGLYRWKILGEGPNRVILKASTTGDPHGLFGDIEYIIDLDKKSYLPKKVVLVQGDRGHRKEDYGDCGDRESYEILDIRMNSQVDCEEWKNPCLDAWRELDDNGGGRWIFDWFAR